MKELFAEFLKEKEFLAGLSKKTLDSYQQAFNCYVRLGGGTPTKEGLKDFVIAMRESGLSAGACNVYIRSINSFLTWLHENEHIPEPLKIKQLAKPQTVIKIFTDAHVQALIKFKPKNQYEWRLYTLISLLLDTGARIDEGLTCLVSNVDLDNLLVKVRGKGNKERLLPISIEMRKVLWSYLSKHRFKVGDHLFPTRDGRKLGYHNTLRDLKELCSKLGIEGVRLSPHGFRHYYSVNFISRGGDIYRLSKVLGHTSVKTTEIYLQSMGVEMVQQINQQLSPLSRY